MRKLKISPRNHIVSLIIKDYADYLGLNGQEILSFFRHSDFEQKKRSKSVKKSGFSFTPQFTFSILIGIIIFGFIFYLTSEYINLTVRPIKNKLARKYYQ